MRIRVIRLFVNTARPATLRFVIPEKNSVCDQKTILITIWSDGKWTQRGRVASFGSTKRKIRFKSLFRWNRNRLTLHRHKYLYDLILFKIYKSHLPSFAFSPSYIVVGVEHPVSITFRLLRSFALSSHTSVVFITLFMISNRSFFGLNRPFSSSFLAHAHNNIISASVGLLSILKDLPDNLNRFLPQENVQNNYKQ